MERDLTFTNDGYICESISEEQRIKLRHAPPDSKFDVYSDLVDDADLPGRKTLRLALLKFVRADRSMWECLTGVLCS